MTWRASLALGATLAVALLLRLPGLAWGLPPATPQVRASDLRSSYAFDEDDILSGVAKAAVARLDFDPHEYHWGTLDGELTLIALDGAQAAGVFHTPWRLAYYNLVPGDFDRVYVVGRLVSVAAALFTIWLLFQIGGWSGAFAGMLIAVAPSHLLQSDQVRVDVIMTAMLTLMLLLAIRSAPWLAIGIAAGLAIAGKYSAVSVVFAIAVAALWLKRFPWRGIVAVAAGTLAGFLAGSPYILIKPGAYYDEIHRYMMANMYVPAEFRIAPLKLLALHAANIARFSIGVPALLLAIAGMVWMARRRKPSDILILAAIAGYTIILFPLRWPLIRYDLPYIVLGGLCAGVMLERIVARWRVAIVAAALVMPLVVSVAQIHYMTSPQTANLMLDRILEIVPPGNAVSRLMPEAPPLDRKIYPMGPNVLMDDLASARPDWVLTSNLAASPYPARTLALLRTNYNEVARIERPAILSWATLGEAGAPQDWMYTHCNYVLYRKRRQ